MENRKRFLSLAGVSFPLITAATWDAHAWLHANPLRSASGATTVRAKYYTRKPADPFTFKSVSYLSSSSLDHTIRLETTDAEDSRGRRLYHELNFNPSTDKTPLTEEANVIEAQAGVLYGIFWSRWQDQLQKPLIATTAINPKIPKEHTLAENNCFAPEPDLQFLRTEPLWIGGKSYPTAVISEHSEPQLQKISWFAMTPGLACLELKSVATYTDPNGAKGVTDHEPVSLALSEPDPQEMDVAGRISRSTVELVPRRQFNTVVEQRSKEYQAQIAGRTKTFE